jgi:hypothetical protein
MKNRRCINYVQINKHILDLEIKIKYILFSTLVNVEGVKVIFFFFSFSIINPFSLVYIVTICKFFFLYFNKNVLFTYNLQL